MVYKDLLSRLIEKSKKYLNLCRVLAYLQEDIVLSKKAGGEWGLRMLPERFHTLIQEALQSYETDKEMAVDEKMALEFAEYMVAKIREYKGKFRIC